MKYPKLQGKSNLSRKLTEKDEKEWSEFDQWCGEIIEKLKPMLILDPGDGFSFHLKRKKIKRKRKEVFFIKIYDEGINSRENRDSNIEICKTFFSNEISYLNLVDIIKSNDNFELIFDVK